MNWFKDRFNLMTPPSHREPLGQLDVWGGRTEPPTEDSAGESRAEVSTPKGGRS